MEEVETQKLTVPEDRAGMRLDRFLVLALPDLSRNRIQKIIYGEGAEIDGRTITDPSHRVKHGQDVTLTIAAAEPLDVAPQKMDLDIHYEDDHLIVVDKPAGMVVHPAPGNYDGTLVNGLLAHCGESLSGIGGVKRPGIVHRIDKDTSGLLVVAKSDDAHNRLCEMFSVHHIERAYKAVVWGMPQPSAGTIQGNIGRHKVQRKKMAVVKSGGKHAVTHYKVEKQFGPAAALVECRLETGRTHQIRVHMTHIGHPLIGDPVYGGPTKARLSALSKKAQNFIRDFNRQALHAAVLGFEHPITGEKMHFESDLPKDLNDLIFSLE